MAKDITNIASSLGLLQVDTNKAIDGIAYDILYTLYRPDAKPHAEQMKEFEKTYGKELAKEYENFTHERINERIVEVYSKWTNGGKWLEADKVQATLLLGPPGQGKTTTFKEAAKKVAQELGLNFKLNPGDGKDEKIRPNDFLFVSLEFSGENQNTTVGGIPSKVVDEATGIEYMTKLANRRLALADRAGGALLLLDDFPNATPSVQNVGLSLTDEKRFQSLNLQNVYIGATGNLGSLDGTHTTRLSTALRGRCKVLYTEDNLLNWVDRVQKKYRDSISDAGIVGFLMRQPDVFAVMPSTKESGGFPSPRTWDGFVRNLRRAIKEAGSMSTPYGRNKIVKSVERLGSTFLGLDIGLKLSAYYNSMMVGADPIARQLIQEGKFDQKAFNERFKDGFSHEAQNFAYQFGVAIADYAVQAIVASKNQNPDPAKNPAFKQAVERFGTGISLVNEDTFSFSLDHFKQKLANQMDEPWSNKSDHRRTLTTEVKKHIAIIISETPEFGHQKREVMIEALADADKYRTTIRRPKR